MNQFKKAEHLSYLEWMKKTLKVQNYFFSVSMGLGAMLSVQLADASQQLGISNGIVLIPAQQQSSDLIVSAQSTPEAVITQYGEYLATQNIDKILELYDSEAEIIPDQLASLIGSKAILSFYQKTFSSIKIKGKLNITSVYKNNDIAIVRCEEPAQMTNLATGKTEQQYFREMFVLVKKQKKWWVYKYMFSQNNSQVKSLI